MTPDHPVFFWTWFCVPYLAAALMVIAVVVAAAIVHGDRVVRIGLIGAASSVAPWALATAAAICAADPVMATRLHQLGSGPTMLLGPNLLLILLSISGQLDRYRGVARLAIGVGVILMLVSWSTALILDGVYQIPSGVWYPSAGPLLWIQALQVIGWPAVGLVISVRAAPVRQRISMVGYVAALPVLAMVATSDTLLAYGIGGGFPFAWLPALLGGAWCLHLMFRTDLLRLRGVDRAAIIELIGYSIATGAIMLVMWLVASDGVTEPVVEALLTAPLWGAVLLASWLVPRAVAPAAAFEHVLDEFAREIGVAETAAGTQLEALWRAHAALTNVRVRLEVEALDDDTQAWLRSLDAPVMGAEVATMRLGRRRPAVERMFAASGAAVVVPVIDRGELIAVVEADQPTPRSLRDAERLFLYDSAQLVGNALTYERLVQDAKAAATSAREVELANVLAAHYRPLLDDELGPWRLAVQHRPSGHPGGDGWSWAQLSGGRIAVMIAEADSQGVAGALVIAALQGAFAARSREASCGAVDLLEVLRDTVADIRRRSLVLVLDPQAHTLTWASDGHRGAAVLSDQSVVQVPADDDATSGVLLLPANALVVLMSSSVAAAATVVEALRNGRARGLRVVAQLVELAAGHGEAGSNAQPRVSRDLLAVGLVQGTYDDVGPTRA